MCPCPWQEEEDIIESIVCGVGGEEFRRRDRSSALSIERVPCGSTSAAAALALPEVCRVAVATEGALPRDAEILWRVTPSSGRAPTTMERCFGGAACQRPYWITATSPADACMLSRTLPEASTWGAHLLRPRLPSPGELAELRDAGCGGVGLAWGQELARDLHSGANAVRSFVVK